MSKLELISFPDDRSLASAAAGEWLKDLRARAAEKGTAHKAPYTVALAGGRIAHRFFSAVAELVKAGSKLPVPVHFFWGDERCVPPTHPESNFGIAHKLLLQPLNIPAGQIHRIHGEAPPETAAIQAANELVETAARNTQRQPVFDMVFLGMGEDGHVASLFPGEPEQALSDPAIYRPVLALKPPPQRITLGYPILAAARQVWVLVSGSGKQAALRESLAPDGRTPLARLLRLRTNTKILTDLEAGH
jgi:6-phosphogluconolactonase